MKISVCMIVKNEEKVIGRCLDCVSKFADEIIVVDTGSTDKTKEIVKRFTDKIYDFAWVQDFSKARNFSFSKASCDYVMWLDADDIITEENIEKINKIKQKNEFFDVFMFKYEICFDKNDNPTFAYYRERLVKRNRNFKWKGFVHEALLYNGKIKYEDVSIRHKKVFFGDKKRNLKLYQKYIKNGYKLSAREQYYYAKELYYTGYYKKCISELKKFLRMENKFEANVVDCYLCMGRCYKLLNDKKQIDVLFDCLKNCTPNSEVLCEIGSYYIQENDNKKAILFYEMATQISPNINSGAFIDMNYYYLVPYLQLVMLYYKVGDYKSAKKYHLKLKEKYYDNQSVLYNDKFFQY